MSTCVFGTPMYSDDSVLYSPSFSGGSWVSTLPLTNLKDRRLGKVARSTSAAKDNTLFTCDLGVDRPVRLVGIPKHSMSSAGRWRVVGLPSTSLFNYEVGDNLTAKGATFSRGSTATYVDANGVVQTAASGVARDAHYINGVRHLLLEAGSTNLCLRSQQFDNASWIAGFGGGVTVTADTATAPDSTTTADTLNDTSAAAVQGLRQAVTVANDSATYTTSVWLKQNTSRYAAIQISLSGGSAPNAGLVVDLSTGASTNMTGTPTTPLRSRVEAFANGWYRVSVTLANDSSGNTSLMLLLYPAWSTSLTGASSNAATGSVYAWGAQYEAQPVATSYIPTTSAAVTRSADSLYFTYTPVPQAMTVYCKFTEQGTIATSGNPVLLGMMGASAAAPEFLIYNPGSAYSALHWNAATVSSTAGSSTSIGDTVEIRATLSSSGIATLAQTKNGGAESVATPSSATALAGSWAAQRLYLNSQDTGNVGVNAFRSVRIATGSSNSLTTMQGLAYDSGWLTPWPGSLTAEDLAKPDGTSLNVLAYTQVPSTAANMRYVTIQFDDTTNTAGYLDIARLCITGALTPSINMSDADKAGYESDTLRAVTPGGAALYDVRASRRTDQFSIDNLTAAESLASVRQMQRQLGLSGQFLWIPDPSDTTYGYERNFLAVMRELGALEARALRYNTTFSVVEEL